MKISTIVGIPLLLGRFGHNAYFVVSYKLRLKIDSLRRKRDEALRALEDDDNLDSITPDELLNEIDWYDKLIVECRKHVEMHKAQREDYNKYRGIAKEDHENNVPLDLATLFLVINMAQNGATPILRGDQMGDFYYMCPLIHLIFGVACPAENQMNVYIWEEGTADRGADNIISCLYHDLVRRKIIVECVDKPLKHLVVAVDNYSGQNKNKAMLMFCVWLVLLTIDNLDVLPVPGLSAAKANECETKLWKLAPDHAKPYYENRVTDETRLETERKKKAKTDDNKQKKKQKKDARGAANATRVRGNDGVKEVQMGFDEDDDEDLIALEALALLGGSLV